MPQVANKIDPRSRSTEKPSNVASSKASTAFEETVSKPKDKNAVRTTTDLPKSIAEQHQQRDSDLEAETEGTPTLDEIEETTVQVVSISSLVETSKQEPISEAEDNEEESGEENCFALIV